jgi:hypothetical protein
LVVAGTVVAGLTLIAPPWEARKQKLDESRVADLINISQAIERYFRANNALPASILDLFNSPQTAPVLRLKDPVTGEPYEYLPGSVSDYQLCASFETSTGTEPLPQMTRPYIGVAWKHLAGRQCFTLKAVR